MYTINFAKWANENNTAVVIFTMEAGAVAISEKDTPEEWDNFLNWSKTNTVQLFPVTPPTPPLTKKEIAEKRLGMTIQELKVLLNG